MAASPSLRRFHGREPHVDSHKRGRSLESGLNNLREKDDDIALFNEMHRREQENFLLRSSNDFEDVFSTRLKTFPDYKLGITIPVRGEASDLLNADANKTDYDWLLTPPETPLFRSLDDEPAPINLVHSGRPQSRPISISRSSPMEKSYRSSRASASPQRLSPSSRSGSSTVQGRPSSAPHLSPTPTLRHSTSLRRPSPPPSKPSTTPPRSATTPPSKPSTTPPRSATPPPSKLSTTPPRSATPPPRRSSMGSGGAGISTGMRATSPVRTGRGYSASPKVRAWQSNIEGFSLEAPPNLRTSLADRPASYVRGASSASRNSKDPSSKFGRQSISPSASRSISSSHTNERDQISSYSRVSSSSSVDDDADSLQSVPYSSFERSLPRRVISGFPNNRPSGFAKKPTKAISPNSASKRSFESAMRQMDRKNPHNMFRPLLSSVPSTFYSGKASSSHRAMVSINSSITTSSNAGSDLATSGTPATEGSDQYHDDMASECGKGAFLGTQHDAGFDKEDGASEFTWLETQSGLHSVDNHNDNHFQSYLGKFEEIGRENTVVTNALPSKVLYLSNDSMEICGPMNLLICSRCGCRCFPTETKNDFSICLDCQLKEEISIVPALVMRIDVPQSSSDPLMRMSDEPGQKEEVDPPTVVAEWPETDETGKSWRSLLSASHAESMNANQFSGTEPRICCLKDPPPESVAQESIQMLSEQIVKGQYLYASGLSDILCQDAELQKSADGSRAKSNLAEGIGVSVLIKKSSSGKGPVLQGRNVTSSAVSYEDSSYARDSSTSRRSSIGYGSASTSSSLDLTVSRHAETFMQRQLRSTMSEMNSKPQSNESTYSGTSAHVSQDLGVPTSTYIENYEVTAGHAKKISDHPPGLLPEFLSASENAELPDLDIFLTRRALPDDANLSCHSSYREKDADTIDMSSYNVSTQSEGNSLASLPTDEDHGLHEIDKLFADSVDTVAFIKDQGVILESSVEENTMPGDGTDPLGITEIINDASLTVVSGMDVDDCHCSSPTSQTDIAVRDDFHVSSIRFDQDEEIKDSVPFYVDSGLLLEIVEDSTVILDDQGAKGTRSLTLEEATDTILFCSSIIHGLAYEAATLAIEKEKENSRPQGINLSGSVPTINLSGNQSSSHRDPHGITPRKRPAKSLKPKNRQVEKETEPTPWNKTGAYEKPTESTTRIVGIPNKVDSKVDSMKPPMVEAKCNCTIM